VTPPAERLATYAAEVRAALGETCLSVVLYGSAAGEDWVAGRSDVNTAVVVGRVTLAVLDALAPVVARWRPAGFALPLVVDPEYLARARDVFPMELDDIRRQHRVLAGTDPFGALEVDSAALRRECEGEARGKLLRLRALYLEHAGTPPDLTRLMTDSLKSFLALLRHVLRLRRVEVPPAYAAVLAAGEAAFGPFPAMRRVLGLRGGAPAPGGEPLHALFAAYLADVERLVAAVDDLGG
jgi:hypothetical protein